MRIGEQQHQIDLVIGDPGVDLLVTALNCAEKGPASRAGPVRLRDKAARCGRGGERLCLLSTLL